MSDFVIENGILKQYNGRDTEVIIPEGVTKIGGCWHGGFYNCHWIESVVLPNSLKEVGDNAFYRCSSLKSIDIPDGVTVIGQEAFCYCHQLKTVRIPDGVQVIYSRAFNNCDSLEQIDIPESVEKLGWGAFQGCVKLKSITIPEGITKLEMDMFWGCKRLESVTLPSTLTEIHSNAFSYCDYLEYIDIPNGVQEIGYNAFSSCQNLKSIALPESVKVLGDHMLICCPKLENLEIKGDVTIKANLFEGALPSGLIHQIPELYPKMADGAIKQHILDKKIWNQLSSELQTEIFLAKQGKTLLPIYSSLMTAETAECIGKTLLVKASAKLSFKECNLMASFMTICSQTASAETLKAVYAVLKAQKNGAKAVKTIEEDPVLMEILSIENKTDENLSEAEKKLAEILKKNKLSYKILEDNLKKYYSLTPKDIPTVKYADGTDAPSVLMQYLLTAHEGIEEDQYSVSDTTAIYKKAGISPDAAEIVALLDKESLLVVLRTLAETYLGTPGRSKKLFLAYPICRYADEDLMRDLTKKAPSWASSVSGIDAPPLRSFRMANTYSETRSAMMFSDRYHELDRYASIRDTDEDTLRDGFLSDVGLEADGTKTYDLGNQTVKAVLQPDLSFIIHLANGKTAKSLPKKSAEPEKYEEANDHFSEMKKSVKKIVKNRKDVLFEDFLSGRTRKADAWKVSYLENPLLRMVASILVWKQDKNTFTLTENGAITADGKTYEIVSEHDIALAHPMEMDKDDLTAWQKYFTSYALKQPFEQIWEPVIDPKTISKDRYKDCKISYYRFTNRAKHGITIEDYDFHDVIEIHFADCDAEVERIDYDLHQVHPSDCFEVQSISFKKYTRMTNHIVAYLDRVTIYDRIRKDDITIAQFLPNFTLAQIMEFIDIAIENNCVNVTALLLNYKNENFADFDPMEAFALDF
ncbi:MAG: leucine-rich repeat protein [Clostridia bacterium]|nr:leucine-rich repeat protein [Clostridia bacterium]